MTDDELTELSAKSVGLECSWQYGQSERYSLLKNFVLFRNAVNNSFNVKWNPLENHLQALRLSKDLDLKVEENDSLNIDSGKYRSHIYCTVKYKNDSLQIHETIFNAEDYPRVFRYVIVQAAAFIGSKLK